MPSEPEHLGVSFIEIVSNCVMFVLACLFIMLVTFFIIPILIFGMSWICYKIYLNLNKEI